MRSKLNHRFKTAEEFMEFLDGRLIPDLKESGSDATAEDFEEACYWIRKFKKQIDEIKRQEEQKKKDFLEADRAYRDYLARTDQQECPDEENPEFLFQMTATSLLVKITKGELSAVDAAAHELRNRGLDQTGKWVGFGNKK